MSKIAELEAQLAEAKAQERAEQEVIKQANKPVWEYTLEPADGKYHTVHDASCRLYTLNGRVTNMEEAKAAGWADFNVRGGGVTYVFNELSGRFVMYVSGGTIYLSAGFGSSTEALDDAMDELNAFVAANPKGGDVTDIVTRFQARNRR